MQVDEQWIIDAYDRAVAEADDGHLSRKDAREAVASAYAAAIENGDIERRADFVDEGRGLFDEWAQPVRERRRAGLEASAEYLTACLAGETILNLESPEFALAYPLGDGTDKILRLWTARDWEESVVERYRNAAAVTAAARRFDEVTRPVIEGMRAQGAIRVEDIGS